MDRLPLILLALTTATGLVACQTTPEPTVPRHRIDYVGQNTFRWGHFHNLSLISRCPTSRPQIRTNGSFAQEGPVHLFLAEDNEAQTAGEILPSTYRPHLGDAIDVDFSAFPQDGGLRITRYHCGYAYVVDVLATRRDGLEVIDHEPVTLVGDPDPGDILTFGRLYFYQQANANLDVAKRRFFHAGIHYPSLAIPFLNQLENQAEDERNATIGAELLNYRDRFELVQQVGSLAASD